MLFRSAIFPFQEAQCDQKETKSSEEVDQLHSLARKAGDHGNLVFPEISENSVSIQFVKVGENPWHFGILQKFRVKAPLQRLVQALDDTDSYVGIIQDLIKIEKRAVRSQNDFILFTETEIPVPFVSNDKTSMHYLVERKEKFSIYRFRLAEGNHLHQYEGLAIAAAEGSNASTYWELDVYEPGFGLNRALPVKKFWIQNAVSSAQACWAFKLKAEGFSSQPFAILEESKKRAASLEESLGKSQQTPLAFKDLPAQIRPISPSSSEREKNPTSPAFSTAIPKQTGPSKEPSP